MAYRDGKVVADDVVRTAGPAARVVLSADCSAIAADGSDLSFITVRVEDKDGVLCPDATNQVHFDIAGPAKIAGVDNGDSASLEPFQADHRAAFHGLALVIVRSVKGESGSVVIEASADGLTQAKATIRTGETGN